MKKGTQPIYDNFLFIIIVQQFVRWIFVWRTTTKRSSVKVSRRRRSRKNRRQRKQKLYIEEKITNNCPISSKRSENVFDLNNTNSTMLVEIKTKQKSKWNLIVRQLPCNIFKRRFSHCVNGHADIRQNIHRNGNDIHQRIVAAAPAYENRKWEKKGNRESEREIRKKNKLQHSDQQHQPKSITSHRCVGWWLDVEWPFSEVYISTILETAT